ncbi:Ankyrin repeat and KH domain-containing protein R11A8.7 [Diplonema papillatum]|nr:Ankyrin repeat and KH domain-containing protein R11A8.7 [Diplonema papillatum]
MQPDQGSTPLQNASRGGHDSIVHQLLAADAIVDFQDSLVTDGRSALNLACEQGNPAVVDCLLVAGAGVEVQDLYGRRPLNVASETGHTALVQRLLDAGARSDNRTQMERGFAGT